MTNREEAYEEYENNMAMEHEAEMAEAQAAEDQARIENEMTDKKIEAKVLQAENMVEIDGEKYPPTQHNLEVWNKYKKTNNKDVLDRLSKVVLTKEEEK